MGGAASTNCASTRGSGSSNSSSCSRLRKALVIRAYNLRQKNETLHDQFRKYAHVRSPSITADTDGNSSSSSSSATLFISMDNIKRCLCLDAQNESSIDRGHEETNSWVDDLFLYTLGADVSYFTSNNTFLLPYDNPVFKVTEINFTDFIRFLESGKLVSYIVSVPNNTFLLL